MSDIVLKNKEGKTTTYKDVTTLKLMDSQGNYNDYVAKPQGMLEIKENGTKDVSKYETVKVNVPTGSTEQPTSEEMTVIPTKQKQEITPKNADYLSKVIVEAIPNDYVIPSGSLEIIKNGEYDVSGKKTAIVNVKSGGESVTSGKPVEVATETELTALLDTAEAGTIYKYTGTSGTYEKGALYIVEEGE